MINCFVRCAKKYKSVKLKNKRKERDFKTIKMKFKTKFRKKAILEREPSFIKLFIPIISFPTPLNS